MTLAQLGERHTFRSLTVLFTSNFTQNIEEMFLGRSPGLQIQVVVELLTPYDDLGFRD